MRASHLLRNKTALTAVILLITLFIGSSGSDLLGQQVKPSVKKYTKSNIKKEAKVEVKEPEADVNVEGPLRLGISPMAAIPLGKLGGAMGIGMGAEIFCDYKIPFTYKNIVMRGGGDIGFIYGSADRLDSTNLFMIPVQARMIFSYPLPHRLDPYFKLGAGMNYAMLSGGESDTSFDLLVSTAIGLNYNLIKDTNFDVFLEAGYMASFESINGNFITVKAGAIYRFPGKGADAEKK